ncbi:hypothetical protein [Amphiplicatus metriothermophilus]|uniref:J domain-containing protein n=1 Tax=Amphiplicatus metriothermophilus TaxID=1519374 RepID=A0A239Q090_9PROT|nr:hypothetical protein [Amphiplicatus metriothermophilus]MBB5520191.1 hypothetical protein [Amphiplicatus metriothermophilus]SNT75991.1 hypothetical protein SAMN06297382_3010 [Amphiplicatus metriothermophilus]
MYGTYLRLGVAVWASDRSVIRAARRKLTRTVQPDPAKREARKRFYRDMLEHHASAQRLVAEFRL